MRGVNLRRRLGVKRRADSHLDDKHQRLGEAGGCSRHIHCLPSARRDQQRRVGREAGGHY